MIIKLWKNTLILRIDTEKKPLLLRVDSCKWPEDETTLKFKGSLLYQKEVPVDLKGSL